MTEMKGIWQRARFVLTKLCSFCGAPFRGKGWKLMGWTPFDGWIIKYADGVCTKSRKEVGL